MLSLKSVCAPQVRHASRLATKKAAASNRASAQHISWIRQSKRDEEAYKEILRVDPAIRPKANQVKSMLEFESPNSPPSKRQQSPEALHERDEQLLRDILEPTFKSDLGHIDLGAFGRITAAHGDIFSQKDSLVVFPIPANLMPYRGISLEALERGGDSVLRKLFSTARAMYSEHVIEPVDDVDADTSGARIPPKRGLPIGSVIPVDNFLFVVVPFYWQGSASDANQRLRHAVKRVLDYGIREYQPDTFSRLVIPHIGRGVFGYEADWSTEALVEESVEALLQLDSVDVTNSSITEIVFMDNDLSNAQAFGEAVEKLADMWLPDRRVTTAPQYLSEASRRMIVMDEASELSTMRRRDKYKFKQYHGKLRNLRGRYFRETLQPWIWRTQKVLEPPPMLVREKTGEISDKQLPARPYFFRGLSHTLFPTNLRTGFPSLRRTRSGHFAGVNRQPDTQKLAKPRT